MKIKQVRIPASDFLVCAPKDAKVIDAYVRDGMVCAIVESESYPSHEGAWCQCPVAE
jgi:hypothetical protein